MVRVWPFILFTLVLLGGCAEFNSVYRSQAIKPKNQPHVVTVDAKQRHLLFNTDEGGDVKWRVCAEAAPDVFSAYAASLSGKGGVDGKTVSAEFGFSGAETAAAIERTQAINMLRESMYRTCERYLSGAIGKTMLVTQAARDQRSMIAFLAIEQLTRAARPPATIISGPVTSASIKDGEAAAKLVEAFRTEANAAQAALATAGADLTKADAAGKCLKSDTAAEGVGADEEAKAKDAAAKQETFAACLQAKALKSTREAENKVAQDRLDQALKLAADTITSVNTATQAGTSSTGQTGAGMQDAAISAMSGAVESIATKAAVDEGLMFCISYLSDDDNFKTKSGEVFIDKVGVDTIVSRCMTLIEDRQKADNRQIYAEIKRVSTLQTPRLERYFSSSLSAAVRKTHMANLKAAMGALGLKNDPPAIVVFRAAGDEAIQGRVIDKINELFPDDPVS